MNLVVLGLMTLTYFGISGSIFLMLAHGITSGVLFLMIGFLYERFFTRIIYYYTGLIYLMPIFGILFLVILNTNSGFPGLCNFIGELFIFIGLFKN